MNIKNEIYDIFVDAIEKAKKDGKYPDVNLPDPKVEYPKEDKFGDYSTPFALEAARILKKSPMDIGNSIAEYIQTSKYIETVEVVRPGFVNIFLSQDYICSGLKTIISERENFGKLKKENPEKINIEFVSANPTGPMNVVSARAAAIGDTIANLIEARGDVVEREFYVNDFGNQVNILGQSVLARLRELNGEPSVFPEEGYQGDYVKDIASYVKAEFSDEISKFTDEDELIDFIAVKSVEYNVSLQKKDLMEFHVDFKTWFRERTLHKDGSVDDTFSFLKSKDVIFEEEGKQFFKSTDYNDDKDRVVVRDDGRPTYLLADIAYHRNKINRNFDKVIDIWGPDHHGYIARLAGAMKVMGYDEDKFKVLIAQQVNLVMEGEAVKMSKRLGKFSTLRELIEEVGVDVSRYFFVMRTLESHLDFDLALAKKDSSENPVFYLQYAHARICSIFREAEKRDIEYNSASLIDSHLDNKEAVLLIKTMLKFPEEISDAALNFEPHRVASYLLKLAQYFHRFYTEHRILDKDSEKTNSYLILLDCIRIVIKNGLNLLGVSAPDSM